MPDTYVVPGNIEERATGVEPVPPAWKAEALPLRYARVVIIVPLAKIRVKVRKSPLVFPVGFSKIKNLSSEYSGWYPYCRNMQFRSDLEKELRYDQYQPHARYFP
jgi:hypothetical protein